MKNINNPLFSLFLVIVFLSLAIFLIGNEKIFLFINQKMASSFLDFIVLKIFIPLFLLLGIIPFLMFFLEKDRPLALFSLISGPLCYLIGNLIKFLFRFPRPYDILPTRIIGPWHVGQFSFPSSTTMLAFGFSLPFLSKKSKLSCFLLTLSFLVGFAVIYTGFHFPADVLVGIFFSILIVFLLKKAYEIIRRK